MSGQIAIAGLLERSKRSAAQTSADPTCGWDDQWDKWDEVEDDPDPGGWGDVMEGEDARS